MSDRDIPGTRRLLFGALIAPVAWAVQFSIHYGLTPAMCGSIGRAVPLVVAIAAIGLAFAGLVVSASAWRALAYDDGLDDRIEQRSRSVAFAGILSATFFAMVIIATSLPVLLFDPCIR